MSLFSKLPQPAEPDLGSVQRSVWFLAVPPAMRGDDRTVGEGELVQMAAVPPGEGIINRGGELLEGLGRHVQMLLLRQIEEHGRLRHLL